MTDSHDPRCTWLASFPKSGSTWLRFMLRSLLYGPATCSSEVEADLPSVHEDQGLSLLRMAKGRIILTHKTWEAQQALYAPTKGFVLLTRHPVDVVLSDLRYFLLTQIDSYLRDRGLHPSELDPEQVDKLAETYLTYLLHKGTTPKQQKLGMGSWAENVESWLAARREHPHIVVRYEDLRGDTIAELSRVASFLGLSPDLKELETANQACSLDALRRMQEREIRDHKIGRFYQARHEAAYKTGLRFVNNGAMGHAAAFSPKALKRLRELFGETIEKLGYHIEDGQCRIDPHPEVNRTALKAS